MTLCSFATGFVLASSLLAAQEQPLIRVPVKLVVAPTLVFSSKGRLLQGLEAKDFRVFDDNQLQKVALDAQVAPPVVVVAVQTNQDVSEYLPFISKAGSLIDSLLLGENGRAAVLSYSGDVDEVMPFDTGDVQSALKKLSPAGRQVRMIDAGMRAVEILRMQPVARNRVLLYIGQSFDRNSTASLEALRQQAQAADVTVYSLTLPIVGKKFVSDTFSFPSMTAQRGGVEAGVELTSLIPALHRGAHARLGQDPLSQLTAATGGTQIHFRKQSQLENGAIAIGEELRSTYLLSYSPDSAKPGYHAIRVEVDIPGAHTYTRRGYVRTTE